MPKLVVKEVTPKRWADFESLFGSPGAPSYCWCMAWRATPTERELSDHRSRKEALRRRVDDGVPVGLIGYLAGAPVAWCSIAPRTTYRPLCNDPRGEGVWSIACFFLKREHRGTGIGTALLAAAVAHARKRGAKIVEGYPVDPSSPSYRFMGYVSMFEKQGFREIGRAGSRRHVMHLPVKGGAPHANELP